MWILDGKPASPAARSAAARVFVVVALCSLSCQPVRAQVSAEICGSLASSFGPFDYRSDVYAATTGDFQSHAEKLNLVERAHFTPRVESLTRGETGTLPGPDLEYTLRVFPNHHRALVSIMRLSERTKLLIPVGMTKPPECYFERALRFQPEDHIARMLYARFLVKAQRREDAAGMLDVVRRSAGDNAITHYNIGLIYLDAEMYEDALGEAHRAMQLGLRRPELQSRLAAAGRWREPQVIATPDASASAPAQGAAPTSNLK